MTQLLIATAMVSMSIIIHLAGLSALLALLGRGGTSGRRDTMARQLLAIMGAAWGLFGLHTVEIWGYAMCYRFLDAVGSFQDALYFSTVTYATIGYGDLTLARDWRILGAIEGANGVILLGWSTAFFISVVERLKLLEREIEGRA